MRWLPSAAPSTSGILDNTLTDAPKDPKVQAAREALVVQQGALFRALEMLQGLPGGK